MDQYTDHTTKLPDRFDKIFDSIPDRRVIFMPRSWREMKKLLQIDDSMSVVVNVFGHLFFQVTDTTSFQVLFSFLKAQTYGFSDPEGNKRKFRVAVVDPKILKEMEEYQNLIDQDQQNTEP